MSFWIIVSLFILVIGLFLALALFHKQDNGLRSGAELDLEVYRDQLKTVEVDLARNVISKQEAARVKTEISRRILDADKALGLTQESHAAPKSATIAAVAGIAVILAGSAWVYQIIGAPGYPDLPLEQRYKMAKDTRANRPSQTEAEAKLPPPLPVTDKQSLDLIAKLREAVAKRPDDLQGHQYLSQYEASIGEYVNAYKAMIKVIEIKKQDATADDYAMLGDLMTMAAGGYISPETETVLTRALKIDKENGIALYLMGKMFAQTGRPDITFNVWQKLLEISPPNAPWVEAIRGQIESVAQVAGVKYTLPELSTGPALAGPSQEDIQAASGMSQEEQTNFINSMVARLTDRLTSQGGSPKEWAQLIGALGVQGNTEKAREIITLAQKSYAGDDAALATINAAAKRAGMSD